MEFITGLKQQEEAELEDLLKAEEGTTIILEGAVHSIRDMGEIAFVILRKREGLIQTVWEEGKTDMELSEIREQAARAAEEVCAAAKLRVGDLFVVGCSSSEMVGARIGKGSSLEAAQAAFAGIYPVLQERGIELAVQCCEHLNRALVVERDVAEAHGFEIVNAIPQLHAGGSFAMTAWANFKDPVLVETIVADAGVDIGGTAVKLGLVDENGRVLRRAERSVSFDGYKTPILDTVQAAIHEFLTADAPRLEGIAVSATGQIDSRRGVVAGTCGNFPGWIGVDIKGTLERAFGLPVTVANDANCMLLGEVWAGAAKGCTDVIGVTLGTGVGGGILTGGRLLEGARGLGGELGHFRLHALDGVACTCGAIGCYERYAATTALVRSAQAAGLDAPDGRAIFEAAAAGDARTLAVLNGWINEIAQGLAGLVHIFNPQLILIGGGVSAQQALLIDPLAAQVRKSIMPAFAEGLEVRAAALQNDAGLVGAVYYFKQQ